MVNEDGWTGDHPLLTLVDTLSTLAPAATGARLHEEDET